MYQMQAHYGIADDSPKTQADCQIKGVLFRSILDSSFQLIPKQVNSPSEENPPIAPAPLESRPASSDKPRFTREDVEKNLEKFKGRLSEQTIDNMRKMLCKGLDEREASYVS